MSKFVGTIAFVAVDAGTTLVGTKPVDELADCRFWYNTSKPIERLRDTEREAGQLDEGAVRAELVRSVISTDGGGVNADRDVAAHGAVFGLVAGVRRDVTARAPGQVADVAAVGVTGKTNRL